jgi:inner membrane transporter RhtA
MTVRVAFAPLAMLLVAMVSIQTGASLAKSLFAALGAEGATTIRLAMAMLILLLVYRPWRGAALAGRRSALLLYGVSLGLMNLFFYMALARVPMGIVVAIEFLGPLGVAIVASRRAADYAWAMLALLGLLLLLPWASAATRLDRLGLVYALLAGAGWALYIVAGRRAGTQEAGRTVALGMIIATLVVLPVGIRHAGATLLDTALWPIALGVAVLSSALPYSLEMYALTRIPTRTFGILMSLEPALAALAGFAVLDERLTVLQWTAIGSVMIASIGSAASAAQDR